MGYVGLHLVENTLTGTRIRRSIYKDNKGSYYNIRRKGKLRKIYLKKARERASNGNLIFRRN